MGRHFTQIDGATIGGPDEGSVTDIFGAIYIDKVIQEECSSDIEEYNRYKDDTADVNTNSTIEQQKIITDWLNENVYKGKIKFKLDCDPKTIPFLDIIVNLINGFLLTETHSKDTDIQQCLSQTSCHPGHILKAIPKAQGLRLRRNCSNRYENDSKFVENLREYKGYMITSNI